MDPKPPTYRIYDRSHGHKSPVVQIRAIKGDRELEASELAAYVVLAPIDTPFYRIRIAKGCIMLLATDAAADFLAAGSIKPLLEAPQVPWRDGYNSARAAKHAKRSGENFL